MQRKLILAVLAGLSLSLPLSAMNPAEQRDYLDHLRQILPAVPSWDQWLQTSGELPPDFDALPKQNRLPDPLTFSDGRAVRYPADWAARREEIKRLFEKYDVGSIPPKPKLDQVVPVSETVSDGSAPAAGGARGGFGGPGPAPKGAVTRVVRLQYGPGSQASLQVTVTLPPGDGPFPVLIGGTNAILARGYINCTFPNSVDQVTDLPALYPGYDFGTMGQQALRVQMIVDYLYTLPQVDKARIAITGYSRLGKMAVIAAAWDDRIAAVVAGSTGVGGVVPWRLGGERNQAESIQSTTLMFPLWFTQRLRFFAGREDRLPVDGNLLVALLAPRSCLIEYGLNDEVSNDFASEAVLQNVAPLFKLAGRPDAVGLLRLPGTHGANNLDLCLDWLDLQFGRAPLAGTKWENHPLFAWDFEQWRHRQTDGFSLTKFPAHPTGDLLLTDSGAAITSQAAWEAKAATIRLNVGWMLGSVFPVDESVPVAIDPLEGRPPAPAPRGGGPGGGPPRAGATGARGGAAPAFPLGSSLPAPVAGLVTRSSAELAWLAPQREATSVRTISFGENLKGDLYYPAGTPPGTKLPTVSWLLGYSYPLGYMWVYKRDLHPILSLVAAGYAVFAYDQSGFGSRMGEFARFYERYPHWSQFGRLVADARAAVDALQHDELVAPDNLSLYGYELGGTVALYTAALEPRVKGVISFCGFTPMRTDTADKGAGGLARFSVDRGLLPRLGLFIGHESQLPYDYDGLIGAIAPRPVSVVAPLLDRDASPADVHATVERARGVYALYGAADKLKLDEPWDYARSPEVTQNRAIAWLKSVLPAPTPAAPARPGTPTAANF